MQVERRDDGTGDDGWQPDLTGRTVSGAERGRMRWPYGHVSAVAVAAVWRMSGACRRLVPIRGFGASRHRLRRRSCLSRRHTIPFTRSGNDI